jgi:hypothetical protein
VGRVTANVLGESSIGVIMTEGDPQSDLDVSLVGTDFRYRNSRLPGGRLLEGQLWYQETETEGLEGNNRAYGAGISSPNSIGWRGGFRVQQFEDNYDPALGFVNRTGIRDYAMDLGRRFRFRDAWLRQFYSGFDGYLVENLATGDVETENFGLRFTFNNNTADNLFSRIISEREVLTEDFTIYTESDGSRAVVIPAGDYSFDSYFIGMRTGEQRTFSGGFRFRSGEFYSGDSEQIEGNMTWRPSEKFSLDVSYGVEDIELPEGDFRVRLSSFRVQYVFSSTLSWSNLVQYDNISENVGFNSRLHWIPEAGREGFIVINHNLSDADKNDSFHSTNADASIKFNYTWRF